MIATFAVAVILSTVVEERLTQAQTPGCIAVALVAEKTETAFVCTPGIAPASFDERSMFEIGSITKGFTGLLLADMVRKGEASLDDSVAKFARPGAKLPAGAEGITLRDLVTHTSGLPRNPTGFNPKDPSNPYSDFTADSLYEALARTDLKERGRYEYSNFGFMWLSEMIARRAGKPYAVVLTERVLDPLGLNDTAVELSAEQEKRFATGHRIDYHPVPHWTFATNLEGVGALRSSLADMIKLAEVLTGRRDTRLKETIALALEPMRPAASRGFTGFGWETLKRGDARVHLKTGGTGGFLSIIAVNPDTRAAAVVLVDSLASFHDLAIHLVDPTWPMQKKRVGLATDLETLEQYVGRYETGQGALAGRELKGKRSASTR